MVPPQSISSAFQQAQQALAAGGLARCITKHVRHYSLLTRNSHQSPLMPSSFKFGWMQHQATSLLSLLLPLVSSSLLGRCWTHHCKGLGQHCSLGSLPVRLSQRTGFWTPGRSWARGGGQKVKGIHPEHAFTAALIQAFRQQQPLSMFPFHIHIRF